jgi:hypothetical protein
LQRLFTLIKYLATVFILVLFSSLALCQENNSQPEADTGKTTTKFKEQSVLFNAFYIAGGYSTNFATNDINVGLVYELCTISEHCKLISFSAQTEYVLNSKQLLLDAGVYYALRQGYICYVYMSERYSTWFIAAHYKFTPRFNQQFICPEFGYDWWITTHFFIVPSLNYYYDLTSKESILKSFYPTIEVRYTFATNRGMDRGWKRLFGSRKDE